MLSDIQGRTLIIEPGIGYREEHKKYSLLTKFCSAGNGAEFANYKFIVINWIMIQYIIFFKISGIIDKIVIDCIVSNSDIGIGAQHLSEIQSGDIEQLLSITM